ncbi:hypothetical protein [Streptomyces sp. NPDC006999]|uniref:SbtR family transcriptional regulator n=1 Tax=unclassified Streptomyces TaxID=2593676 RepID=UPI0033DCFDE1
MPPRAHPPQESAHSWTRRSPRPDSDSRTLLTDAVATLLAAGARDGSLRTDAAPDDVLLLMGGIAYSVQHGTKEQARPLVDLFMDALTRDSTAS